MSKNIFIVYAHPEKSSFNRAVLDTCIECLRGQGHQVQVSDLYAMKFNPIATRNDFKEPLKNPEDFQYAVEAAQAWEDDRLSDDVKLEQEKLDAADLLIFQCPMYWMQLPAILKGWMDRVFLAGYSFGPDNMYDLATFKGKKAMLSLTTGGPEGWFSPSSPNGDINVILWPIQNALRFVGFDILPPQLFYGIDFTDKAKRLKYLHHWKLRLESIFDEKPIFFPSIKSYVPDDPNDLMSGFHLKEEVVNEQKKTGKGFTVGQHLGLAVPVD